MLEAYEQQRGLKERLLLPFWLGTASKFSRKGGGYRLLHFSYR
jgi:hypothetical protein